MTDHTLYLAGPVAALDDGGASWREEITTVFARDYNVQFNNPVAKYNAPAGDVEIVSGASDDPSEVTPEEIVDADKDLLRESDGVLVGYSDVQSVGTPMEVMWASERDLPVVIWIRDGTSHSELSPWYRHHATVVTDSVAMAVEVLLRRIDD